jgi:hypothetical protein
MSAGRNDANLLVVRKLDVLAPRFRIAVEEALAECAAKGYDAYVYESLRSNELQEIYYRRGRPPSAEYPAPVTNAKTADRSWHFFGLAVDVISQSQKWSAPEAWWKAVAEIFRANGCKSGYYWARCDKPHHQWGKCRVTPSPRARALYSEGGLEAVWEEVGAL